jgi:hypothetical protein
LFDSWLALTFQATQLGLEAQNVIALRLMRLADGGAAGVAEARLMVTDKMAAVAEAQLAATAIILMGNGHKAGKKVLQVLRRRVRANKHRLIRSRS